MAKIAPAVACLALILFGMATLAGAQDSSSKPEKKPNAKSAASKNARPNRIGKKRRAELMQFVQANHPELQPLLQSLKKNRPPQFQAALRRLNTEVTSLQNQKKRNPERYELALAHWVTWSKFKLLSAKLAVSQSEDRENEILEQIQTVLDEQADIRQSLFKFDIEAATERINKMKQRSETHQANRDQEIDRRMNVIKKRLENKRAKSKSKNTDKTK